MKVAITIILKAIPNIYNSYILISFLINYVTLYVGVNDLDVAGVDIADVVLLNTAYILFIIVRVLILVLFLIFNLCIYNLRKITITSLSLSFQIEATEAIYPLSRRVPASYVQSNPDIRMSFGDSKIKDIVGYPYIENDVN